MAQKKKLETYLKKRDFRKTEEPSGSDSKSGDKPIFVIQKHAASSLHYDVRLEIDGVLVSWAVPKGPSTDPSEKRLAIHVEDHPMDYKDFEGVIPEGEYGAGAVIVWDAGTYENLKKEDDSPVPMKECLENGHIEISLQGSKLKGGYALRRFRKSEDQWLLIKMKDDQADARRNPVSTEPKSVLSGRTIEDLQDEDAS